MLQPMYGHAFVPKLPDELGVCGNLDGYEIAEDMVPPSPDLAEAAAAAGAPPGLGR